MIDDEETKRRFGYTSEGLSYGSGKRVWRVCEKCGKGRSIRYRLYRDICAECTHNGKIVSDETKKKQSTAHLKRGPFNIEYFQSVEESISDSYINELRTFDEFEYYSVDLLDMSGQKVWRICKTCNKERKVRYSKYIHGQVICKSCAQEARHKLIRGPFDVKYFHAVQKSIDNGINEIRMFNEYKYYSIDLLNGSTVMVWRICKECGIEDSVRYSHYTAGITVCKSCVQKHKIVSEETRRKSSATKQGIPYDEWTGFSCRDEYPPDFTQDIRQEVRASTDDRDFLTGEHKDICNDGIELSVHHIDYDKQNTAIKNLIPLSRSNHAKTNANRKFWIKLFTNMQNTRYLLLESEATHE